MKIIHKWQQEALPALLGEPLADGSVRCHLSPRNCVIKEGGAGFCKVRVNRGGQLMTLNYGKAVHHTEETIETEACFHYAPGERILSMGNIGCMLNCGYCHNWQTSQARFVQDKHVHYYTPEQVVQIALDHNIRVLSWTYNDPVVWLEFILETAKLAKEAGIINLYKSAFFITPKAVELLLPYMDIFSISVKSIDPEYYKKITTGWVEPVLEATKQVLNAGKHVEVSTLMVTGISDNEETAQKIANWVLTELNENVPLHFVRFHPDYKMKDSIRTPIPNLIRAREVALKSGVKHVYLGNVNGLDAVNTYCKNCNTPLVTRYGLNAQILGLNNEGKCKSCGYDMNFKLFSTPTLFDLVDAIPAVHQQNTQAKIYEWHGDIASIHVQVKNNTSGNIAVYHRRVLISGEKLQWQRVTLKVGESYRYIIAKSREDERGAEVLIPEGVDSNLHELFDRAFFPVVSIEDVGITKNGLTPEQVYPGRQIMYDVLKSELKMDS